MQFDIRRLDIYRKIPKDLTQPTYTGACISILSCLFLSYLFIAELSSFLQPEIISDMYVADPVLSKEKIKAFLDLSVLHMHCQYLGLDIQDETGRHEVGFVDDTMLVGEGEGCRVKAHFVINRVPGNFHISTHSAEDQPDVIDMTHRINELHFGNVTTHVLGLTGSFTSLKNISHDESQPHNTHEYFLKIVPSHVEDGGGNKIHQAYQYTYAHRQVYQMGHGNPNIPVIIFRHDLNPISVRYILRRKPLYSFLTTICAIIGGTFTVAGIFDSMIFSASEVVKKMQLGKLS